MLQQQPLINGRPLKQGYQGWKHWIGLTTEDECGGICPNPLFAVHLSFKQLYSSRLPQVTSLVLSA